MELEIMKSSEERAKMHERLAAYADGIKALASKKDEDDKVTE